MGAMRPWAMYTKNTNDDVNAPWLYRMYARMLKLDPKIGFNEPKELYQQGFQELRKKIGVMMVW